MKACFTPLQPGHAEVAWQWGSDSCAGAARAVDEREITAATSGTKEDTMITGGNKMVFICFGAIGNAENLRLNDVRNRGKKRQETQMDPSSYMIWWD
jgi:hypothetical protein